MVIDVDYINPIIKAIFKCFKHLLKTPIKRGLVEVLRVGEKAFELRDIVVIMGVNGGMRGTVALVFPAATALAVVSMLLDKEAKILDGEVMETIKEMAVFIEESANKELERLNPKAMLKTSRVGRGDILTMAYTPLPVWLEIPFESELGTFSLRINMSPQG